MNCPVCGCATCVDINTHATGFAKNVMECSKCEAVWLYEKKGITILKAKKAA